MRKLLFVLAAITGTFVTQAQEMKFGVKAGIDLASTKVDLGPLGEVTGSETGYYLGGFATIGISEKFAVQPELMYVLIKDFNFLSVPILAKYELADSFHVLAGPSLNYFTELEEEKFKINVDFGASYDISEEFDVNAKYSLGTGDVAISGIFIGAGYKF